MSDEAKSLIMLVVTLSLVPSGRSNQITSTWAPAVGGLMPLIQTC